MFLLLHLKTSASLSGCLHAAVLFCVPLLSGKEVAPWAALGMEAVAFNSECEALKVILSLAQCKVAVEEEK